MKTGTKARLANLSIWIILVTIGIIILWFIAFILMQVFDLKVFALKSTEFFYLLIFAAFAIVACAAGLNISLNISIVAENMMDKQDKKEKKGYYKKILAWSGAAALLLAAFLFTADFFSRNYEKNRLIAESKEIIGTYQNSLNKIADGLTDRAQLKNLPGILSILSEQKEDFPDVELITAADYDNQAVYLSIKPGTKEEDLQLPYYGNSFYRATREDGWYLDNVFKKNYDGIFFYSKDNGYYLYYPVQVKGRRFILLFFKYNSFGSLSS